MDPLTQGLLGASFGQALYGRALGRKALVWGAIVGMAPDLDVVANPASPMAEWLWHRGPTHALWFGPVVLMLGGLGLFIVVLRRRSRLAPDQFEPDHDEHRTDGDQPQGPHDVAWHSVSPKLACSRSRSKESTWTSQAHPSW